MMLQDATRFRLPTAWRVESGAKGAALLALALGPLFLAAWQLKPLYADNQNTKFLHALANSGAGFLREDWLAHTKDGLPLFTALLEAILRTVGPDGFYLACATTYGIFLFCALLIYRRVTGPHEVPLHGLPVFLGLLFTIAMLTDVQQIVFSGFSEQYILGGYFQSADFGVFLIAAVLFFERRLLAAAMACIVVAASMHPGYVAPGAVLIVSFLIYELTQASGTKPGEKFAALASAAIGLAVLFWMAFALKQLFAATDPQTQLEAHRILTAVRIPRHADPWHWFNVNVVLQFALVAGAARFLPPGRLRFVIRFGLAALAAFTLVAFLPGMETYRLVAPWRISVVLVPLATIALCAVAIVRLNEAGRFPAARQRAFVLGGVAVVLFCTAVGSAFTAYKFLTPEPPYVGFVRANLASGQHYLTSPSLREFRLATGVPQYVTFKSHPYQDVEVLEWQRRLTVAQELYAAERMDCEALQRLAAEEAVTHIVVTGRRSAVSCPFASKVFEDGDATIFGLGQTKFTQGRSR